jgi:hypothetical protein
MTLVGYYGEQEDKDKDDAIEEEVVGDGEGDDKEHDQGNSDEEGGQQEGDGLEEGELQDGDKGGDEAAGDMGNDGKDGKEGGGGEDDEEIQEINHKVEVLPEEVMPHLHCLALADLCQPVAIFLSGQVFSRTKESRSFHLNIGIYVSGGAGIFIKQEPATGTQSSVPYKPVCPVVCT